MWPRTLIISQKFNASDVFFTALGRFCALLWTKEGSYPLHKSNRSSISLRIEIEEIFSGFSKMILG